MTTHIRTPERTADASTLLTVLNIEAMSGRDDLIIVKEFIHAENIKFVGDARLALGRDKPDISGGILLRPAFMAGAFLVLIITLGHVYAQTMLDTVICQNFYKYAFIVKFTQFSPHLLNLLRHVLFSGIFHQTNMTAEAGSTAPLHSHLWIIKVPQAFIGSTYRDYFTHLTTTMAMVPIGLYRRPPRSELTLQANAYVCVNPTPQTRIRDDDFAYVLSIERP